VYAISLAPAAPLASVPGTLRGTLIGSCGADPGVACRLAWDLTHSTTAAQVVQVYLAGPVGRTGRIVFIVLVALIIRAVTNRLINKITERAAATAGPVHGDNTKHRAGIAVHLPGAPRREQRARALGSILRSAVSVLIFGTAALMILGVLGFDLAPLLASTAVLGVALGFGAQNLVRDYLAGILMLVEDHYGVGDTINVKDVTGTVEAMTLLTTRLRDLNGVVWHIRNGIIDVVGNESQGWSRAVIDYPIAYSEDLDRIRLLMEQAADSLYRDRRWGQLMLEEPEVWGAQELSSKEVTMRIVAKTEPMHQWEVARELRARVKSALDTAGVVPAGPDTIIITAPESGGPGDGGQAAPAPEAAPATEAVSLGEAGPPGEAALPAEEEASGEDAASPGDSASSGEEPPRSGG
jgi:moderate conductance mechanosensitive channel